MAEPLPIKLNHLTVSIAATFFCDRPWKKVSSGGDRGNRSREEGVLHVSAFRVVTRSRVPLRQRGNIRCIRTGCGGQKDDDFKAEVKTVCCATNPILFVAAGVIAVIGALAFVFGRRCAARVRCNVTCAGCCTWLVRCTLRDRESEPERARKELMVPVAASLGSVAGSGFIGMILWYYILAAESTVQKYNVPIHLILGGIALCWLALWGILFTALLVKALSLHICEVVIMLLSMSFIAVDAGFALFSSQYGFAYFAPVQWWCLNVVVLDMALVINVRPVLSRGICALTAPILKGRPRVLEQFEGIVQNALFFMYACYSTSLLALDFHFTRGFADGMRRREEALQSSIAAAEDIGEYLIAYITNTIALIDVELFIIPYGDTGTDYPGGQWLRKDWGYWKESCLAMAERWKGSGLCYRKTQYLTMFSSEPLPEGDWVSSARECIMFLEGMDDLRIHLPVGKQAISRWAPDDSREDHLSLRSWGIRSFATLPLQEILLAVQGIRLAFHADACDCMVHLRHAASYDAEAAQGLLDGGEGEVLPPRLRGHRGGNHSRNCGWGLQEELQGACS
eukprot:gene14937-biopygen5386